MGKLISKLLCMPEPYSVPEGKRQSAQTIIKSRRVVGRGTLVQDAREVIKSKEYEKYASQAESIVNKMKATK